VLRQADVREAVSNREVVSHCPSLGSPRRKLPAPALAAAPDQN
jgi:hypothetical protein